MNATIARYITRRIKHRTRCNSESSCIRTIKIPPCSEVISIMIELNLIFVDLHRHQVMSLYYIPINVISLDTVDFTDCLNVIRYSGSPLWFSESISPLSETDDIVHNVFLNTQEVLWPHSYRTVQICTKYFICFKMKPINHTPKH